jgi:hypothetical protein
MQVFKVTCLCGCIISLWFDRYEFTGGAHGNTVRTAQTWNLQSCVTLKLSELALCPSDYMTCVLPRLKNRSRKTQIFTLKTTGADCAKLQ